MPKTKNIKNIEYWRKRLAENQENILRPADDYIIEVETIFKQAENEIKKEIALWYQRFADNNGITDTAEARKRLKGKELAELKWNVAEYIKHGRENGISADWAKELENASARVHINRLEALEFQCRQYIENLYTSFDRDTGMLLENIYTESMYHTAYEIAKGIGIGSNFAAINTAQLKRVISKPWSADGKNFSQRIWEEHRTKLVNILHNRLSRGILTGKSPDKIIDEIAKDMKSSKDRASRLVMTESAYFASLSQKESFKKLGVKKYQILGTLDSSTCEDCGELDGKVIELKEFEVAATAPPFHCWCRCTMVPFFDDEFTEGEKRFARDKDGNVIYVSADMTYEDWKKKFVDEGVDNFSESGIIKVIPTKVIEGHLPPPIKSNPNDVIDHRGNNGKVKTRSFYDNNGNKKKDINTDNHNNPKNHPYGQNGEHAHDYTWKDNKIIGRNTRELTDMERKENGDIL